MKSKELIINFGNLVNEMMTKNFVFCFIANTHNICIEHEGYIYAMETRVDLKSYLDFLISNNKEVRFGTPIESKNIPDYQKEIWDSNDISAFIARQKIFW